MNHSASSDAQQPVSAATDAVVMLRAVNRVAILTLNRPDALNALDLAMVRELAAHLEQCRTNPDIVAVVLNSSLEKAFCAGGDVRQVARTAIDAPHKVAQFFIEEYQLDHAIHRFLKPVVVLMDGITMGGGMGLAQGASLRVTTERSKIAMPETRIGLVPDVGATHFLRVMPVEMALFAGLTGTVLNGADAVYSGLADVSVPSASLAGFEQRLEAINTERTQASAAEFNEYIQGALREVFASSTLDSNSAPIAVHEPWISTHFDARRPVVEIVASLREALKGAPSDTERTWLRATLDALLTCSPTMIHVTREALLKGRHMSLADCFRMEMGIVVRTVEEGDFREGVRAHLIDKDRRPQWRPATLEAVTREQVETLLHSPWSEQNHPLAALGHDD